MYELSGLLSTISSCASTIVAIIGGFIASKLVAISIERNEILKSLCEVSEEIEFKSKQYNDAKALIDEDDALDFINENIESIIKKESLDFVYKMEEQYNISKEVLQPYWNRAISICESLYKKLVVDDENTNEDGIPNSLSIEVGPGFEYSVCENASKYIKQQNAGNRYLNIGPFLGDNNQWYRKKRDEMNEANAAIEWLSIKKNQLIDREDALKKPKGMTSGLIIFVLFTLTCIIGPLLIFPFKTNDFDSYLFVKTGMISLFSINLITVFVYLIYLLNWKEKKEV